MKYSTPVCTYRRRFPCVYTVTCNILSVHMCTCYRRCSHPNCGSYYHQKCLPRQYILTTVIYTLLCVCMCICVFSLGLSFAWMFSLLVVLFVCVQSQMTRALGNVFLRPFIALATNATNAVLCFGVM